MGQRRLATPQGDDPNKRGQRNQQNRRPQQNNSVLARTNTRRGEAQRAQRRNSENVKQRASQHVINIPVNKSIYNGYQGQQFSLAQQKKERLQQTKDKKLKIIPIGGLGEMGIGKNMTAIEYGDDIIVIDMGLIFPGNDYPGVNYIVPDTTYLEQNKHKIRAHLFTHAHLDHIGAVKNIIHKIPAPVYGTKFTLGMIQRHMEEAQTDYEPEYHTLDPFSRERIQFGDNISVEAVHVLHSIPGCVAFIIRTPVGVIVHTGDWRFEDKPVDGKKFDLERLTEVAAKEGIHMLLNESTNIDRPEPPAHGEFDVAKNIGAVMDGFPNSRVIASCFSSQIHRLQLILNEAKARNRKVAFAGFSMINNLETALRTQEINVPKDTIVKMEDLIKLPDGRATIVCTGSQGEMNAVLNRMATGAHKHIKIKNTDVVVFSSSPIPGNEPSVIRTVDGLMREGAEVIRDGKTHIHGVGPLHLSGHASYEEHVKLVNALNPTWYMPIHGEFHMLVHNAEMAEQKAAIPRKNIIVCDSGDVVELDLNGGVRKAGRVPVGGIMFDDSGAEVSDVVVKDRLHMSNEGMFIAVLTIGRSGRLLTSPDIISRGFIYLRDSEELIGTIRQYLKQKIARSFSGRKPDIEVLKKELKEDITHILYDQTKRTPIVIPVINEVADGGSPQAQRNAPRKMVRPPAKKPQELRNQHIREY